LNISVLCFNRHNELVLGCVDAIAENGDFVTVNGKHYQVANIQPKYKGMIGSTRVVDFIKWKEKKKEVV